MKIDLMGYTEIHRIYKNRLYNRTLMKGNITRSPASLSRLEKNAIALTERFMRKYNMSYFPE